MRLLTFGNDADPCCPGPQRATGALVLPLAWSAPCEEEEGQRRVRSPGALAHHTAGMTRFHQSPGHPGNSQGLPTVHKLHPALTTLAV